MRKMLAVLVVMLVATPAMAAVNITCTHEGAGVVRIDYDAQTEVELVRAVALDITVDDGTIVGISDYPTDGSNYGIYPGSIEIVDGNVVDYNDPVAPSDDPGAKGGIDTAEITIEMGSLYEQGGTPPPTSGTLCKISVDSPCGCTVSVALNDTRGGIVLEDASTPGTVNLGTCLVPGCFPSGHPDYAEWLNVGCPQCWCYPRQCHGDADGAPEGKNNYWVAGNDLAILRDAWLKPLAQLSGNEICADFDHATEGKNLYRVAGNDLQILRDNWLIGNGPAPDCFD